MKLQISPTIISPHIRETLKLAWPIIMGQIGHIIIMQADTIMIGQLGKTELAAATLANSIFFLPFVIGFGICMAISPLVAQALGAKEDHTIKLLLKQSGIVAFWSGLFFVGLTFLTAEIIPFLDQEPDVVPLAQSYLRIVGISALPMLFFLTYKHFADGFEDVRPGMVGMWVMVGVNILLNYLLINGIWIFPRMELEGAGWATVLARLIGGGIMIGYVLMSVKYKSHRADGGWFKPHKATIQKILNIGLPSGMQYFFEVGSFTGAVIMIGWISSSAQSAHQIALGVPAVTYMIYLGISGAAAIRVGNALGRKDMVSIREAGIAALKAGGAVVLISSILILALHKVLPGLYIDDLEVQQLAAALIVISALFQLGDGIQAIALGALRGMEDVKIPAGLTFIAYWVIGLPVGYLLMEVLDWGVEGMWYGLSAGLGISALFLTWRFERKTRTSHF